MRRALGGLALLAGLWVAAVAAAEPKTSTEASSKPFPYHGKLAAVDAGKMTLTLEGKKKPRVILVTATTKFTKDGKAVRLIDGRAGDPVAGLMIKNAEGQQQAISVRFGPKPATVAAGTPRIRPNP